MNTAFVIGVSYERAIESRQRNILQRTKNLMSQEATWRGCVQPYVSRVRSGASGRSSPSEKRPSALRCRSLNLVTSSAGSRTANYNITAAQACHAKATCRAQVAAPRHRCSRAYPSCERALRVGIQGRSKIPCEQGKCRDISTTNSRFLPVLSP
jgi:hypothetical protein